MHYLFYAFFLLIPFCSCSQKANEDRYYDKNNYVERRRGPDNGYPFVLLLVHKEDTNYTIKRNFIMDSTFMGNSYTEMTYYKGVLHGPFALYVEGQVTNKGTYHNGKLTGERLTYSDGVLVTRAFFQNGVKIGKWEEYDEKNGKLKRILIFDDKGNLVKDQKLN